MKLPKVSDLAALLPSRWRKQKTGDENSINDEVVARREIERGKARKKGADDELGTRWGYGCPLPRFLFSRYTAKKGRAVG